MYKVRCIKLCANGHNSQHCWPNDVESCCVHLHIAESLSSFKLCATTPNNITTKCNRMCQRTQHVTFNNVGSCWLTMLHPFARGFKMKRTYRGVFMEGFDPILCGNFVVIFIKGDVDKPIFFWFTSGKLSDLQLEGVLYAVSIIVNITYHFINNKNSVNICLLLYCSFFCPHKAFKIFGKRWISS